MVWLAQRGRWKSVLAIGGVLALLIAVVQANPAVRSKYSSVLASSSGLKVGQFPNAALEQYALTKVNTYGGSCRNFVNNVVSVVSHGGINIAYDEGNYFQAFIDNHATPVTSVTQLLPGDIVQQGQTDASPILHTFIIVSRVSVSGASGVFKVVDSNHDERYRRNVVLSYPRPNVTVNNTTIRAYRLGYVTSSGSAPPPASGGNTPSASNSQPNLQGGSPNLQGSSPNLQGSSPNLQGSSPNLQGGSGSQGGGTPASKPEQAPPSIAGSSPPAQPVPTTTPKPTSTPQATTQPPPSVPTYAETAGGVAHTWTNYVNAGGTEGPSIGGGQTVQIACRVSGFKVADGNTAWYRIASSPWSGQYYVSADAFYNDGQVSGSLIGTPFYDPAVPLC